MSKNISVKRRFTKPLIFTIPQTAVISNYTTVFKTANNLHIKYSGY